MPDEKPRVVCTSPTWQMNGVNVFTENLVRGLRRRGWDARVLLTNPARPEPTPMAVPDDLHVESLAVANGTPARARWSRLESHLRAISPCVYLPNYDIHASCISPLLPNRVVIVGVVHADDVRHYEHLIRLGHTWNAVVAVSGTVAARCKDVVPHLADRISCIPLGVPIPPERTRSRLPLGADRPVRLAYTGLLKQHQKRIFDVPLVLDELASRGVPFRMTIAGDGPDRLELERRCADMIERGLVRFTGVLGRKALESLLEEQDAVILTSEFEGLPNALLEAMAHGCVPVTTAVESGVSEVVRADENGLVAAIGDVAGLAEAVARLVREPGLLDRLAESARRTVIEGPFSLDTMVDRYESLFRDAFADVECGRFRRRRGPILPPPDLQPLWRHFVPEPLKTAWRALRRSRAGG